MGCVGMVEGLIELVLLFCGVRILYRKVVDCMIDFVGIDCV